MNPKSFITHDGHRLAYLTAGDPSKPPLLLVHGLISYGGAWRHVVDAFRQTHYCIVLDLLGFGDSDKPRGADYSIDAQARRVLALADALGVERFTLMGHSMGGQINLYIASTLAPERVARLVVVGSVASGKLDSHEITRTKAQFWLGMKLPFLVAPTRVIQSQPVVARWRYAAWFASEQPPFAEWREDVRASLLPGIQNSAYPALIALQTCDLTAALPRITAPTLVIVGMADHTVPPSEGELVCQRVPDCQIVRFEDCGHFPMYERTGEFLDALHGFCSESREDIA